MNWFLSCLNFLDPFQLMDNLKLQEEVKEFGASQGLENLCALGDLQKKGFPGCTLGNTAPMCSSGNEGSSRSMGNIPTYSSQSLLKVNSG